MKNILSIEHWKLKSDADVDAAHTALARYSEHLKRQCPSEPVAFWLTNRAEPSWIAAVTMFDRARDLEEELRSAARSEMAARLMDEVVRDASPALRVCEIDTAGGGVEKEIQLLEETAEVAVIHDFTLTGGLPQGMNAMRDFVRSMDRDPRPAVASVFACDRNDVRHCFALHVFKSLEMMEAVRDGPAMGRLSERLLEEIDDPDALTAGTYDVLLCTGGLLGSALPAASERPIEPRARL